VAWFPPSPWSSCFRSRPLFPWTWPSLITSWKSRITKLPLSSCQVSLRRSWIHSPTLSSRLPPYLQSWMRRLPSLGRRLPLWWPWGLKASSVVESSEVKPPDLTALEVGLMGAALVRSRRSVRLAVKCRGETFNFPILRRRLPDKVVSRRCMIHPMLCSSCLGLSFVATAPPGCYVVSGIFLRSACCKEVQTLHGRIGCHE
jgi:hypothetical protein